MFHASFVEIVKMVEMVKMVEGYFFKKLFIWVTLRLCTKFQPFTRSRSGLKVCCGGGGGWVVVRPILVLSLSKAKQFREN